MIQAQIFEDHSLPEERKHFSQEFNVMPHLPPEYGGSLEEISMSVLLQETCNDEALRALVMQRVVPTVDTIIR